LTQRPRRAANRDGSLDATTIRRGESGVVVGERWNFLHTQAKNTCWSRPAVAMHWRRSSDVDSRGILWAPSGLNSEDARASSRPTTSRSPQQAAWLWIRSRANGSSPWALGPARGLIMLPLRYFYVWETTNAIGRRMPDRTSPRVRPTAFHETRCSPAVARPLFEMTSSTATAPVMRRASCAKNRAWVPSCSNLPKNSHHTSFDPSPDRT